MDKFKAILRGGAQELKQAEQRLCDLDAATGDGDHGVTMGKIADAIIGVCDRDSVTTPKEFFEAAYDVIMAVDGGSVTSLWGMMMDGIAEALPEQGAVDGETLGNLFAGALDGFRSISDARPGEKTILDALAPCVEAAQQTAGTVADVLAAAAAAAESGAEATKGMIAQYGRAKNLRERSLGKLDPGAVSFALFVSAIHLSYLNAGED